MSRRSPHAALCLLLPLLACGRGVTAPAADPAARSAAAATDFSVNGADAHQAMEGMGTNVNVDSWRGGELAPALDLLAVAGRASLLRVIRDPMDWVASEADLPALHALDPVTLQRIYEAPAMQDLWSTIAHLNGRGLGGDRLIVTFMGWTPTWLGGSGTDGVPSRLTAGKEGELATMIASLAYYGHTVRGLDFALVSPLNEPDLGGIEGPSVGAAQYAALVSALIAELDAMGLADVRVVAPDTATPQPGSYVSLLLADPVVAPRLAHLAIHDYGAGSPRCSCGRATTATGTTTTASAPGASSPTTASPGSTPRASASGRTPS